MRTQLITVFLVTFAIFIGVLVWRVDGIMFSDKLSWSEAQSRSQMSLLAHSLEIEFSNLADTLANSTNSVLETKKEYSKNSPLARYQMVATLKSLGSKDWSFDKTAFLDKSQTKTWATQYITILLKNIDTSEIGPGGFVALSLLDPQRKPYLFLVHHSANLVEGAEIAQVAQAKQAAWYGVLVGPEFFQSLMDRQKGQMSSVFLVNQMGQALGHTTPEYVGNLLSEDPIVAELMRAQTSNGSGTFKNLKGDAVHGFYEQVAKSNVYAVITTPVSSLLKNREQVRIQILMMGLGLAFLGLAIFVFVYRPEKQVVRLSQVPLVVGPQSLTVPVVLAKNTDVTITPGPANLPPVAATGSVASEDIQKEKMQIFMRMASALSHEIKGPLAAILGHVQLLRSAPDSMEHISAIEDHARKSRELIQKLMIFSGEDAPKFEKIKLTDVVRKALRNVEAQIFRKGIKLDLEDLKEVSASDLPSALVCRAIENILNNSIEAMERVPKKEMKVSLAEKQGVFELSISDTGEGIESQKLAHIFEPFFTTKGSQGQVGLGLSMSLGILREIKGKISVESERGKGTTFKVIIDPAEVQATLSSSVQASPAVLAATKTQSPPLPEKTPQPSMMILDDQEVEEVLGMDDMSMASNEAQVASVKSSVTTNVTPPVASALNSPPLPSPKMKSAVQSNLKIDKPNIKPPAKSSKLDQVSFQVRRPGEKSIEKSGDKS